MELIRTIQSYSYVAIIFILTIGLYAYIYYLYKSEKDGVQNFEKYSNLALHDELDDEPVEEQVSTKNHKDK